MKKILAVAAVMTIVLIGCGKAVSDETLSNGSNEDLTATEQGQISEDLSIPEKAEPPIDKDLPEGAIRLPDGTVNLGVINNPSQQE